MKTTIVLHALRNLVFAAAAVMLTFALFSPVAAADRYVRTTTITVKFGDLDLKKPADVKELYHRIRRGSDQACLGHPGNRSFAELLDFERCREIAIANAVRDVKNGELAALHDAARRGAGRVG